MVLKTYWACAIILCCLVSRAPAAGIQLLDSDPRLTGAIWYPCAGEAKDIPLGALAAMPAITLAGVRDCAVTGAKLPLIVFSHGYGGWFTMHQDTAEALADAGFVVAVINHPGDNGLDRSQSDVLSVWATRPADIVRLLDFMLHDWKDRAVIDPARVGFVGFSKGGFTGLLLIGASPDYQRLVSLCTNDAPFCVQVRSGDVPHDLARDTRIKAAVLADPAHSGAFTRDALAGIRIPLQVWRSEVSTAGTGIDPEGVARVLRALPGSPEIHVVPAGHFAFLMPCSPAFAAALPRLCIDPPGFDRVAFHRDFDASVVRFFREQLVGDGGVREGR